MVLIDNHIGVASGRLLFNPTGVIVVPVAIISSILMSNIYIYIVLCFRPFGDYQHRGFASYPQRFRNRTTRRWCDLNRINLHPKFCARHTQAQRIYANSTKRQFKKTVLLSNFFFFFLFSFVFIHVSHVLNPSGWAQGYSMWPSLKMKNVFIYCPFILYFLWPILLAPTFASLFFCYCRLLLLAIFWLNVYEEQTQREPLHSAMNEAQFAWPPWPLPARISFYSHFSSAFPLPTRFPM